MDAQFSIPYAVANALVRRGCEIEHFTLENVGDPAILGLAQKVHAVRDDSVATHGIPQGCVTEIRTNRGTFSRTVGIPRGYPKNPLTREELVAKFRQCVARGPRTVTAKQVERIITIIDHLDEMDNVASLVDLMS